jgi:hypothetical protein
MKRFTTPFGFTSTATEVIRGGDLCGKSAIVTGGASVLALRPLALSQLPGRR